MTTANQANNKFTAAEITDEAVRLTNCANGNPRYYISALMFRNADSG